MSKTPRTDAAAFVASDVKYGLVDVVHLDFAEDLETELADLKAQFAEYVRAEENWRDSSYESDRWKAKELLEKAILTLGL
jgi:hypothetical protein